MAPNTPLRARAATRTLLPVPLNRCSNLLWTGSARPDLWTGSCALCAEAPLGLQDSALLSAGGGGGADSCSGADAKNPPQDSCPPQWPERRRTRRKKTHDRAPRASL